MRRIRMYQKPEQSLGPVARTAAGAAAGAAALPALAGTVAGLLTLRRNGVRGLRSSLRHVAGMATSPYKNLYDGLRVRMALRKGALGQAPVLTEDLARVSSSMGLTPGAVRSSLPPGVNLSGTAGGRAGLARAVGDATVKARTAGTGIGLAGALGGTGAYLTRE